MLTDVQTLFLGTPLVSLILKWSPPDALPQRDLREGVLTKREQWPRWSAAVGLLKTPCLFVPTRSVAINLLTWTYDPATYKPKGVHDPEIAGSHQLVASTEDARRPWLRGAGGGARGAARRPTLAPHVPSSNSN